MKNLFSAAAIVAVMLAAAPGWTQEEDTSSEEEVNMERFARLGLGLGWAPGADHYSLVGLEIVMAMPYANEPGLAPALSMDTGIYGNLLGGSGDDSVQASHYASVTEWRIGMGAGASYIWDDGDLAQVSLGLVVAETSVTYTESELSDERKIRDADISLRVVQGNVLWGVRVGPNVGASLFTALAF